jgi:hypothetical protein
MEPSVEASTARPWSWPLPPMTAVQWTVLNMSVPATSRMSDVPSADPGPPRMDDEVVLPMATIPPPARMARPSSASVPEPPTSTVPWFTKVGSMTSGRAAS